MNPSYKYDKIITFICDGKKTPDAIVFAGFFQTLSCAANKANKKRKGYDTVAKSIKQRINDGVSFVKTRWKTPAPGETTNLSEFISYCFGTMGICGFTFICGETVAFVSGYFCGAIMEIKLMDFTIVTFIALAVRYLTLYIEGLSMTVFENLGHIPKEKVKKTAIAYITCVLAGVACYFVPQEPFESLIKGLPGIVGNILVIMGAGGLVNWFLRAKLCRKYGRYKPFMMVYGVPITILTCIITFVPTTLEYSTKIIVLHFLFTLRTRFTAIYCDNPTAIVALISPNMVERQKYYSFGGIFLGFFRSIFRIIFPLIISATGGYFAIKSYRVFIPIFAVASMLLGLSFAKVKERVAVNEDEEHKVEFKKSAKTLLSNKYFWMVNLSDTFQLWNELGNGVLNFIIIYQMRFESILGLLSIFGITSVIGNVLTPLLVKKYEKRTCILLMRSVWLVTTCFYFAALKFSSVPMFLIIMFVRSAITAACNNITKNMSADVLDYHQWKTGERADNMQQIFQWFTTPIATALGLVSPWLLGKFGYTSDWDVLYDASIFNNIMIVYIALNIVGLILSTVPYFFYDLTRAKHDEYVAEIAEREKAAKTTAKEA